MKLVKQMIQAVLGAAGYRLVRKTDRIVLTHDMEDEAFQAIYRRCAPFTMTSMERMYALYKAVEYIVNARIPGDLVECGVWRGGSCMLGALALMQRNDTARRIYLYDTFAGMAEPTDMDIRWDGEPQKAIWEKKKRGESSAWCEATMEEVERNMNATGYPRENIVFVKGKVEETIPDVLPAHVALLRLDTDWHESTRHELRHLFPRLATGGVLILDDYGYFKGVAEATDTYFREHGVPMLLQRVDEACRLGIKIGKELEIRN